MPPLRLGVLVSGGGTSLQNFLDREKAGTLEGQVALVVSSDPGARAVERAAAAGRPCVSVPWRKEAGTGPFSDAITRHLEKAKVHLVLMAGFLKLYRFPEAWAGRVMNIHPALLPAFGGQGMYGIHVHSAVVKSGAKVTGCTVHFADLAYDKGPVILQRTCPVRFEDSPQDVAARVFELEKEAYPEAVSLFARGKLRIEGRRVRVLP